MIRTLTIIETDKDNKNKTEVVFGKGYLLPYIIKREIDNKIYIGLQTIVETNINIPVSQVEEYLHGAVNNLKKRDKFFLATDLYNFIFTSILDSLELHVVKEPRKPVKVKE